MGSYLLIGDVHLSDRPPASCTDSYLDDLFDILEFTVNLAKEHDAVAVQAGDFFHIKTPGRTSHKTVSRAIDLVKSYPNGIYIVPGNHDLMNDRFDSLESQPLGVLFRSGAKLLNGWVDGLPLYGVPWLQRFTSQSVSDALKGYREAKKTSSALVVTHAPLYPPSQELPYEFFPSSDWDVSMGEGPGFVYYGHVHEAHGTWQVGTTTFCNQGALSRGSLHEHNRNRKIAVTLWNDINGEFKRIEVPHKPAEDVFRITEARELKMSQKKLDDFLKSVGQQTVEITSVSDVIKHVKELGLSDEVIKVIEELLGE